MNTLKGPISTTKCIVIVLLVLLPVGAFAYLPSPTELRHYWDQQRLNRGVVYLRYESNTANRQVLEVRIRPDGLWGKRITLDNRAPVTHWYYGSQIWRKSQAGHWKPRPRKTADWDDWAFEPLIDVLLQLTPAQLLSRRGLGHDRDHYEWIYGGRSERSAPPWFSLIGDPVRISQWVSDSKKLGFVRFKYQGTHKYPDIILFKREARPDFLLIKTDVQWVSDRSDPMPVPSELKLDPKTLPIRPEAVTTTTHQ